MITGRVFREGAWWAAEAPMAGVFTQGKTRVDAIVMLADAFESLIDRRGISITVSDHGEHGTVLIEASDPAALAAYLLKYQRETHGLSLAQVAKTLGVKSRNAYARYEQGVSIPTISKFCELLKAVAPEMTMVLVARKHRS